MGQDHYEFEIYASRADLWLGYAGTFALVVVTGGLLVFGVTRRGWEAIGLFAASAALFALALIVARRALVEASTLKIGTAGCFLESLRSKRFIPWADVIRVHRKRKTLRIIFRDGDAFDEAWARVGDPRAGERIEAFAARQIEQTDRAKRAARRGAEERGLEG